jgi:hypothetical protein
MDGSIAAPAFAAGLGVVAHHAYFIHGDHLTNIPPLLLGAGTLYLSAIAFLLTLLSTSLLRAWLLVTTLYTAFGIGLFGSIFIYRVWFHRLNEFPGPWGAKVSKWYHIWCIRKLDQYKWYHQLFQQYGPVVRIGTSPKLYSCVFRRIASHCCSRLLKPEQAPVNCW